VSNTDGVSVSVDVTNTGRVAGVDVPQLYVRPAAGDQPRRLAGWSRLTLQPGETRRVVIKAEPRILANYDTGLPGWRIAEGAYAVSIARDAEDPGVTGETTISGTATRP
jgi:beta-glucosidase